MRKEITFMSIALTTFVLAMTAGVVYAYKSMTTIKPTGNQSFSTQSSATFPLVAPAPVQAAVLSPQDASSVAAKYLNRTDLYSVEMADFNGVQAYKVTFSLGDVVYVDMNGIVLASVPPPAPVIVSSSSGNQHGGRHGGGGGGEGEEGEHEGGEHEGGDD